MRYIFKSIRSKRVNGRERDSSKGSDKMIEGEGRGEREVCIAIHIVLTSKMYREKRLTGGLFSQSRCTRLLPLSLSRPRVFAATFRGAEMLGNA